MRIICGLCASVRNCGCYTRFGYHSLCKTYLSQVDIVRNSFRFYKENKRLPQPEELDPDIVILATPVNVFASQLLKTNYREMPTDLRDAKLFFVEGSSSRFAELKQFEESPEIWMSHVTQLKDLGHIPKAKAATEKDLHEWCRQQRQNFRGTGYRQLQADDVAALQSLRFWKW